ncbi:pantoate--beta-alanine ligase [Methylobacillus sp. MM3]|uniref:pantoate--beta-alanine ligase n=1 Tax=Methylobacillus sp. MM3 TaxID=1848039 RepID=UPI0007E0176F|nr:pantoate--beta-alanine ligase [Methylobacillus sp. MM3]OAJ69601.1 pantoate--beta-alanine ligase [Methylobacillus sp. MM3]
MEVIGTIEALRQRLARERAIAFVPTMGNLHAGHLQLVEIARQRASCVVVSIFVNPLQFGANEDLASYPRTLEQDCVNLEAAGADIVFTPSVSEMYPVPQHVLVEPSPIANALCGAARPGHFRGVATVVLKLFNMVQPQVAIFGKKDFQQLFILRDMVQQLNLPIAILAGETVRETDGLAMSSRNSYLKPAERMEAPRLYRALLQVVQAAKGGRRDFDAIEAQTAQYLTQLGWIVDYISVRSATTLLRPAPDEQSLVVLGAARLGKTRLIDNIEFAL